MSASLFDTDRAARSLLHRDVEAAIAALHKPKAETMAKAVHAVLLKHAALHGQDPACEVAIFKPGQPRYFREDNCWTVTWEAGPHDWAISISMMITTMARKVVEPYYGFDLCFYPNED